MSTHAGKEGVVKIAANAVAEMRNWEVTERVATIDDTEMSDAAETHLVGRSSWDGSIDCWWDETDTTGQGAMTVGASVTLNLYPEGAVSGDTYYTGTATITEITRKAERDGMVEASFSFKGNGALTESTVA